jgi:hypothetical protein
MSILRKTIGGLLLASTVAAGAIGFGGVAGAYTGTVGARGGGNVLCVSPGSTFAGGSNVSAGVPALRAVNRLPSPETQTVSYQPVAFRWNGSAWVEYAYGTQVWGVASETANPASWYRVGTNTYWGSTNVGQNFTLAKGQFYKVAYKEFWYDAAGNVNGTDYQWAASYKLSSPVATTLPTISYCST